MTWPTLPTTLALSFNDLVFYGFVFVFVAGPWLAKTLKKSGSLQRSPQSTRPIETAPTAKRPSAVSRRQPLEELARQRRAAINPQSTSTEPLNLTMSQRTQRAHAQAAYQQRSQQLNQPSQPVGATGPVASSNPQRTIQTNKMPSSKVHRAKNMDQILTAPALAVVERQVPDPSVPSIQNKHVSLGPIDARRLRDAIVLKEILDRPLALREGDKCEGP